MQTIQYQKYCPTCRKNIDSDDIVRGYEYQKGNYVIINEEDFERIPVKESKTIDILDFVNLDEVDPIYFDKSYYLEPSEGGEKAYLLLMEAMSKTKKIAIAKIVIRSKESLVAIRIKDSVIIMETIFFPSEIRSPTS